MKTPTIMRPLLFALLISSNFCHADIAKDEQILNLTVPLVALINVQDISPSFAFTAPTTAGEGFSGDLDTESNNTPTFAISSNNKDAKLNVSIDKAFVGVKLTIKELNGGTNCFTTAKTIKEGDGTLAKCAIGMFKNAGQFELTALSTSGDETMIPHGTQSAVITYTLTQS